MHKSEFSSLRILAVKLFDNTFNNCLSNSDSDQIFYILSKKFINHINSFSILLNGTDFNDIFDDSHQVDHSSAKVVLRAAFESYLTMAHLYWNKPELTDLRLLLYIHSGLKERQGL